MRQQSLRSSWRNRASPLRANSLTRFSRPGAPGRVDEPDAGSLIPQQFGGDALAGRAETNRTFFLIMTTNLPGLKFDGVSVFVGKTFLFFTELDATAESYGASFTVPATLATPEQITQVRETMRAQFQAATNSTR